MTSVFLVVRTVLVRAGFAVGRLRPLRAQVVLATPHASAIGGNLAFIRDALTRLQPDVHVVELAFKPGRGVRAQLAAAVHALRAGYLLATSRLFVVDGHFIPMYVISPRPGTRRAQVWHGSGAFKKVGYSVLGKTFGADASTVRHIRLHTNYDLALVSSASVAPAWAEAFRQPVGLFTASLGIPRTDLFFDQARTAAATDAVRRRYAIPDGRRVILFAPTFRGDRTIDARLDDDLDLSALQAVIGQDHIVLLRAHPSVAAAGPIAPGLRDFVIDVSDHPDINELMLVSDILVTDYSSAMYEFALLDRPILFFAPDLDAYERERGFYFDYRTGVPGPIFTTTEALAHAIRAGGLDTERVTAFARASFDVADGRATERFVVAVVLPALAGMPITAAAVEARLAGTSLAVHD